MAASFEQTRLRRLGNALISPLARLGLAGQRTHVLPGGDGHDPGRPRSTPVQLVRVLDRQRWGIGAWGEVDWGQERARCGRG